MGFRVDSMGGLFYTQFTAQNGWLQSNQKYSTSRTSSGGCEIADANIEWMGIRERLLLEDIYAVQFSEENVVLSATTAETRCKEAVLKVSPVCSALGNNGLTDDAGSAILLSL